MSRERGDVRVISVNRDLGPVVQKSSTSTTATSGGSTAVQKTARQEREEQSFLDLQKNMEVEMERKRTDWEREVKKIGEDFFQIKPTISIGGVQQKSPFEGPRQIAVFSVNDPHRTKLIGREIVVEIDDETQQSSKLPKELDLLSIKGVDRKHISGGIESGGASKKKQESSDSAGGADVPGDDELYRVHFDVKGYKPKEIKVSLDGKRLTITAKEEDYQESSTSVKQFNRQVDIPDDVETDKVISHLSDNGILTIEAPKKPEEEPKQFWEIDDNSIVAGNRAMEFATDNLATHPDYYHRQYQIGSGGEGGGGFSSSSSSGGTTRILSSSSTPNYSRTTMTSEGPAYERVVRSTVVSPPSTSRVSRVTSSSYTPVIHRSAPFPGEEVNTFLSTRYTGIGGRDYSRDFKPVITTRKPFVRTTFMEPSVEYLVETQTLPTYSYDIDTRSPNYVGYRSSSPLALGGPSGGSHRTVTTTTSKTSSQSGGGLGGEIEFSEPYSSFRVSPPPVRISFNGDIVTTSMRDTPGTNGLEGFVGKPNTNIVETENGKKLKLSVKVGTGYQPQEIVVSLDGRKVLVNAKHDENVAGKRVSATEFSREFAITDDIEPKTLRAVLGRDGTVCIGGSVVSNKDHGTVLEEVLIDMPSGGKPCKVLK